MGPAGLPEAQRLQSAVPVQIFPALPPVRHLLQEALLEQLPPAVGAVHRLHAVLLAQVAPTAGAGAVHLRQLVLLVHWTEVMLLQTRQLPRTVHDKPALGPPTQRPPVQAVADRLHVPAHVPAPQVPRVQLMTSHVPVLHVPGSHWPGSVFPKPSCHHWIITLRGLLVFGSIWMGTGTPPGVQNPTAAVCGEK